MLRTHGHVLADGDLVLRPLAEGDWDAILPWNRDPEVLWFSEADRVETRTREDLQAIYRHVSRTPADIFVFELAGTPVGDGWVQDMNLGRVLAAHPGRYCRRVDLQIARPWWGRGIGKRAIRLLTAHAFASGADLVFALDVASDNVASRRAFFANRYVPWRRWAEPAGAKVPYRSDLVCRRDHFEGRAPAQPHPGGDGVMAGDDPGGCMIVVWRRRGAPDGVDLLLLHRAAEGPAYEGDWAWTPPSGARFPAEPPEQCAAHELQEETGLDGSPRRLAEAGSASWWIYALEVAEGAVVALDAEHDRFEWVAPQEALRRCRPAEVRDSLAQAVDALRAG